MSKVYAVVHYFGDDISDAGWTDWEKVEVIYTSVDAAIKHCDEWERRFRQDVEELGTMDSYTYSTDNDNECSSMYDRISIRLFTKENRNYTEEQGIEICVFDLLDTFERES